jgi:uncharacterized repeat protein (TIGR03833 family)
MGSEMTVKKPEGQTDPRDGTCRESIQVGDSVEIVLKKDQSTGKRTRGIVSRLLTSSKTHPHGIKVKLKDGQIGRVKKILGDAE